MKYRVSAKRTEIIDYIVEADDPSEAMELVDAGVEIESPFSKEGCELHSNRKHGIVDIILDDDEDQEILNTEEIKADTE